MVAVVSRQTLDQMDTLAELMAEGCASVSEAARQMGMKQSRVDQLWQRIKKPMGAQAQ